MVNLKLRMKAFLSASELLLSKLHRSSTELLTISGLGMPPDIWAGLCGEIAGEKLAVPALLGLSINELSVSLVP